MIRFAATLGLSLSLLAPSLPAFAACQRDGNLVCGVGNSSSIFSPSNDAQVSSGGAYAPLASNAPVGSGARVLVGTSTGTVSLGQSCAAEVGPGALISIVRQKNRICAQVVEASPTAPPGTDLTPIVVGGAAALGIGMWAATSGGGKRFVAPATVSAQ